MLTRIVIMYTQYIIQKNKKHIENHLKMMTIKKILIIYLILNQKRIFMQGLNLILRIIIF